MSGIKHNTAAGAEVPPRYRLNKTVALVGMMGAGKTAVGRAVAAKLAAPFLDSDAEIEAAANLSVPEIFTRDGEPFFRRRETEIIARLLSEERCILSTGGGAFLAEVNRDNIAAHGVALWLDADLDLLWNRVRYKDSRPLLRTKDPKATLATLYHDRVPLYRLADLNVRCDPRLSIEAMAERVIDKLLTGPMFWRNGMRETISVALPGREYDVIIGPDLLAEAGALIAPLLRRKRVAVISETRVAAVHLDALRDGLAAAGIDVVALELPPGEGTKDWASLQRCVGWLLDQQVERGDVVVAFGGGVIGDLVGFAAAVLRRGVRFVQIPTSLLAQVDSSVGGKTGINAAQGKNLIGAFHQPSLVLADTSVLNTLTPRDFIAGYGEVVKYGLLGDAVFFDWLEAHGPAMAAGDMAARVEAVRRSVQMKADIVLRDETEQGDRALLNLGHTFGHALEAATGYSDRLLHGEGVAIGCALAFELSARLGLCSQEDPSRLRAHLAAMGMKTDLRDIPGDLPRAEELLALMGQDKKVVDGRLRFVLARGIGKAFAGAEVDEAVVLDLLRDALSARQ